MSKVTSIVLFMYHVLTSHMNQIHITVCKSLTKESTLTLTVTPPPCYAMLQLATAELCLHTTPRATYPGLVWGKPVLSEQCSQL